jgi:hypothetical protein
MILASGHPNPGDVTGPSRHLSQSRPPRSREKALSALPSLHNAALWRWFLASWHCQSVLAEPIETKV